MTRQKSLERFTKSLLATTCLTVAAGATASGAAITEGTLPAPDDFDNSQNGNLLPSGTTSVDGGLNAFFDFESSSVVGDTSDWFQFQGLTPGANFSLKLSLISFSGEGFVGGAVFDGSGPLTPIDSGGLGFSAGNMVTLNGVVPGDGRLVVNLGSEISGEGVLASYTADLTTDAVPEPSTLGTAGLGLAAVAAATWNRRRKQG